MLLPCPGMCSGQEELGRDISLKVFSNLYDPMIPWTGSVLIVIPERGQMNNGALLASCLAPTSWTLLGMFSSPAIRLKSFANTPHKLNPARRAVTVQT